MGKVGKGIGDAFSDVVSGVGHAVSRGVRSIGHGLGSFGRHFGRGLTKVGRVATKPIENVAKSSVNVIKDVAKGNIGRAIADAGNIATGGTVDLTGKQKGIVNIDSTKYVRSAVSTIAGIKKPSTSTSSAETYQPIQLAKASTSQVMQLRKGRGLVGGGSYSETVKNPLGGSAGKTGK